MDIKLLLILSIFIKSNLALLISCRTENDNYDSRINNIINFLKNEQDMDMDSCRNIFILQVDKCNVCSENHADQIMGEIKEKNMRNNLFVFTSYNEDIFRKLLPYLMDNENKVVIDHKRLMAKYGLSFMKNIYIKTCKRKVQSWIFYD